jgi:hypothetical protein
MKALPPRACKENLNLQEDKSTRRRAAGFATEASEGCRAEAHLRRQAARPRATARQASLLLTGYGLASHAAIINGKDSRKGRRGSRFQLKYRKQPHAK